MRRVGAVDDEELGGAVRGVVDGDDRLLDRVAVRKPAVGLDGEADDDRNPRRLSRTHDPDPFLWVGQRECGRLRTTGLCERPQLD